MKEFIKKVMSNKTLLLTYNQMLEHPIGQQIEITKGFRTERLPTTKNILMFRIELDKDIIIPYGMHDCIEEVALYSGKVLETFSQTLLNNKKKLTINPYTKHGFIGLDKTSVFYAYLYK